MQSSGRATPPPPSDWNGGHKNGEERLPRKKRSNKGLRVIFALLIAILLLSLIFLVPINEGNTLYDELVNELSNSLGPSIPAYADFTITRSIFISTSNGEIDYTLDIPMPEDISSNQNSPIQVINGLDTSPSADEIIDKYGTDWAYWNGTTNSYFTATITYDMRVYSVVLDISKADAGTIYDIPDNLDRFLDDEWKIEPSLSSVSSLANSLAGDSNNVYTMVKAVYDHMRSEFTYDDNSPGEPKTCSQTLIDGRGDCDDQSILFISMLRSLGIPAWLEFGPLFDPHTNEWGAHAWSKVYIPLADGGGGAVTIDVVNGQFMVKDCSRFTEWESDGEEEHLEDYYRTLSYSYIPPQPDVDITDSYSGDYSPSDRTVNVPRD